MLTRLHASPACPSLRTKQQGVVKEVRPTEIELQDGGVLPYGLCIWSTGVGPTPFTLALPFAKTKVGRLCVDSYLRAMVEAPGESGICRTVPLRPYRLFDDVR